MVLAKPSQLRAVVRFKRTRYSTACCVIRHYAMTFNREDELMHRPIRDGVTGIIRQRHDRREARPASLTDEENRVRQQNPFARSPHPAQARRVAGASAKVMRHRALAPWQSELRGNAFAVKCSFQRLEVLL